MINRRPYIAESDIKSGCGVVQGSADNKVKAPTAEGDSFIGVYAFESNDAKAQDDRVGIVISGIAKVLLADNATAGKKAVFSTASGKAGAFADVPEEDGEYATCGLFLESGVAGEYVDMFVERGTVTVAAADADA